MRVLILADELFSCHERTMLARLEIGLADEGVRVVHAIPQKVAWLSKDQVFSQPLTYDSSRFLLGARLEAMRLMRALAQQPGADEDRPIDIVHVFGGAAWELGREIARQAQASLVLEVWRAGLAPRAAKLAAQRESPAPLFTAPDAAIERAILGEGPGISVRLTPWGVHTHGPAREILPAGKSPSLMVVGAGLDRTALGAALEGIASVVPTNRDLLVFMDAHAAHRARIWPVAQRLGMLEHLSLIESIEDRRDLLTQGDLFLEPEARGEARSALLEAMAAPMAIAAAMDKDVSPLISGQTAVLVRENTGRAWSEALRSLLGNVQEARRLAASAREWVRQNRPVSGHVRSVLETYAWLTQGDAIPFRLQ